MTKNLATVCAVILCVCITSVAFALPVEQDPADIDSLLAPYQAVIDAVNQELGSYIHIPPENKKSVYAYYQGMSLDAFEKLIKEEYLATLAGAGPSAGNEKMTEVQVNPKLVFVLQDELDVLLAPFQLIIDRVNLELGTSISIPYENRAKVYAYYQGMTLDEFEKRIREEYLATFLTPTQEVPPEDMTVIQVWPSK